MMEQQIFYRYYKLVLHHVHKIKIEIDIVANPKNIEKQVKIVIENYQKSILCTSTITSYYYGEIEKFED